MNIVDIILAILLVWALFRGFREGILVQICGLAGLFLGVYLAFRLGGKVGALFGADHAWAPAAGFAAVIVAVLIILALLGRLLRGLFRFAGLGILDGVGGATLSLLKTALVMGLLLYAFGHINKDRQWVGDDRLDRIRLYPVLTNLAEHAFPYMDMVKDKLFYDVNPAQVQPEPEQETKNDINI